MSRKILKFDQFFESNKDTSKKVKRFEPIKHQISEDIVVDGDEEDFIENEEEEEEIFTQTAESVSFNTLFDLLSNPINENSKYTFKTGIFEKMSQDISTYKEYLKDFVISTNDLELSDEKYSYLKESLSGINYVNLVDLFSMVSLDDINMFISESNLLDNLEIKNMYEVKETSYPIKSIKKIIQADSTGVEDGLKMDDFLTDLEDESVNGEIVGSALLKVIKRNSVNETPLKKLSTYLKLKD